ncbi:ectonucleotide pyrophosphatase/phosphodiesterase family member 5 [Halyomorpha halys]|uniref:ectonucleotide pyrophosphatase/phosphodiesterase family member 5 n=1 Tax=Halyomorpha halys TaxID=286706 RepID=UPI0006D4D6C8|nr:ectonucleotide pyrophosphatase/phosphodiesterase family member 5 [Halyomorpha halys]
MHYPLLLATLGFLVNLAFSKSPHEKLLVVSYDGFRFDYLNLNITPHLNSLKKSSTYAKCLLNVFPTQTYVNHFSLATGLYSESHGVIGNSVYDKEKQKLLYYSYDLFHYNKNVIPIWALNERAGKGRHSGVWMWAGGEYEYGGVNATFTQPYVENMPWKESADKALSWFLHPKTPANLVMLYFDEPDNQSHSSGPATISERTREQIKKVDNITKYIVDYLKKNDLEDVNVVFLSDHGMEGISLDQIIDLTEFVGNRTDMYGASPVLQIYPKPGQSTRKVYKLLQAGANKNKHFKVYLKRNIPYHFRIKNCKRTAPIIAVADPPYGFQDYYKSIRWQIENRGESPTGFYGIHGYDPLTISMHPYFIAHGPLFRKNYAAGVLRTVDMYPLFAHVLKLKSPRFKPNGSFFGVKSIFRHL